MDLFIVVAAHTFYEAGILFWFSIFLRVTCVFPCKQKSVLVTLHDHSVGLNAGHPNLAERTRLLLTHDGIYTTVSYKSVITRGNVPAYPHTIQILMPLLLKYVRTTANISGLFLQPGKWRNASLPFAFV